MTRIIALVNQKGGVGKTTSTINIGAGLNRLGKSVLLVDLDPQANLTYSLGVEAHNLDHTVYELLTRGTKAKDAIIKREAYDIIPASLNLSGAEIELTSTQGRETLLKEALVPIKNRYDYILLDCPPSLGLLTVNGLTTAKEVFVPLQTEFLALQGMSKLLQTVEVVKEWLNPAIEITGIIGTLFDSRKRLNREVIAKIQEYFNDKLFQTIIRDNISLAEAPSFGQNIFEYKPQSYGAEDYLELCKEITEQEAAKHE
jgi:chromosome partitioning protein